MGTHLVSLRVRKPTAQHEELRIRKQRSRQMKARTQGTDVREDSQGARTKTPGKNLCVQTLTGWNSSAVERLECFRSRGQVPYLGQVQPPRAAIPCLLLYQN